MMTNKDQTPELDFNPKDYLKNFGAHLRNIRIEKKYSQDRLCLEAGFARGTLSKIEAGKVDPQLTTLARIADTLNIPLKKILDFTA